eukprot:5294310-Amphidinium_carterae.1
MESKPPCRQKATKCFTSTTSDALQAPAAEGATLQQQACVVMRERASIDATHCLCVQLTSA